MNTLCRIELLGELRVAQADRTIRRFATQKTASLLAYLAYQAHPRADSHPREHLIELLWPEAHADSGRHSLSMALSSLRRQIEPPGTPPGSLLQADRLNVRLRPDAFTTDVAEFETATRAAAHASRPLEQLDGLQTAVDLYRGELLAGLYDDWILPERQRLNALYQTSLQGLLLALERAGEPGRALDCAFRALRQAPLDTVLHAAILRLFAVLGQADEALQHYAGYTARLHSERQSPPPPALKRLAEQIAESRERSHHAAGASTPALSATPAPATVTWLLAECVEQTASGSGDELLRQILQEWGGRLCPAAPGLTAGAFPRAREAVQAALRAQRALRVAAGERTPAAWRMALDTNEEDEMRSAYALLRAAHPGHLLCGAETAALLQRAALSEVRLEALGLYRVEPHTPPRRLFAVAEAGWTAGTGPRPNAPGAYPVRLPRSLTRFFGREKELASLLMLLGGDKGSPQEHSAPETHCVLVTLTGPGGCGKTRLALEAAAHLADPGRRAVWFTSLADLTDPRQLFRALAATLELPGGTEEAMGRRIVEMLSAQPTLLVLDNCEHLLPREGEHTNPLVDSMIRLLNAAPELVCLATSRQRLEAPGEQVFPLPPLPLPAGGAAPERLSRYASVRLFLDRARHVRPDFQITPRNAADVAALCVRLEGLPLALELAAARTQTLTPAQMLRQLDRRFDFLVSRPRDAFHRHRSLRAAVDWSYRLLSPERQRLFGCLSVFRGGWTLESAGAVCALGEDSAGVLDGLEQLCVSSLVVADEPAAGRQIRFRMLETLREYALEALSPAESAWIGRRHAEHFLGLAETASRAMQGPEQADWLAELDLEQENMRAALRWFLERADAQEANPWRCAEQHPAVAGLRLARALAHYWEYRGPAEEGAAQFGALLMHRAALPLPDRAAALAAAGALAVGRGDYSEAERLLEECLACTGMSQETQIRQIQARALHGLGTVALCRAETGTARSFCERAVELFRTQSDSRGLAAALSSVGLLHYNLGDLLSARVAYSEALPLLRKYGDRRGVAVVLNNWSLLEQAGGDIETARTLQEESLALHRALGNSTDIAGALRTLARIALEGEDHESAHLCVRESLLLVRERVDRLGALDLLELCARLAAGAERAAHAAVLLAASEALRREVGLRRSVSQQASLDALAHRLAVALGEDALRRLQQRGACLDAVQALDLAWEGLKEKD